MAANHWFFPPRLCIFSMPFYQTRRPQAPSKSHLTSLICIMPSSFKHTLWSIDIEFFPQPRIQYLFMHDEKTFLKKIARPWGQLIWWHVVEDCFEELGYDLRGGSTTISCRWWIILNFIFHPSLPFTCYLATLRPLKFTFFKILNYACMTTMMNNIP